MSFEAANLPKIFSLYLKIRQYPMLARIIRERMRGELQQRGIVSAATLEKEVRERAIASQRLEGIRDPEAEELPDVWEERKEHVRDQITDFYFAYNLQDELFDEIVAGLIQERTGQAPKVSFSYTPEAAPIDVLFHDGEQIEKMPPDQQQRVAHHLEEIIVVIIKAIISDRLDFVGVAKQWLTIEDLQGIRKRRFGRGKIGGKAAGMLLAWKILQAEPAIGSSVSIPVSYFVGTDVFHDFKRSNGLMYVTNQKYKTLSQIREEYPAIQQGFAAGQMPEHVRDELRVLLDEIGRTPLVVRSSSLLEDSAGTAFAGKYDSFFCPNQAGTEENLERLTWSISQVYASVYSPDALIYRQRMGLVDYDERMAILLQVVEGERHGDYFYPPLAGVAFGRNPFRWTQRIRREDGLARLVFGLGTRAVERTDDYTRLVALSHPLLRPEADAGAIRHYSQHQVDLLNLATNALETHPLAAVLRGDLPWVRQLVSEEKDGYLQPLFMNSPTISPASLVLTFDPLLKNTQLVPRLKHVLRSLANEYGRPVDVEFTARIGGARGNAEVEICLVQCRPQSVRSEEQGGTIPPDVPAQDRLFATRGMMTGGEVTGITHAVFVPLAEYNALGEATRKLALARVVGRVNQALEGCQFVLIGPNRWGSSNPDLGVKATYADVYNTRMLIEIVRSVPGGRTKPEASHGTHFFLDLVEARIFPLAVFPDEPGGWFDEQRLLAAPNLLASLCPQDAEFSDCVRVIDLQALAYGQTLTVTMDAEDEQALGYFRAEPAH
ncbi:MAG: PEP/pyruvate-binding domain-containing protein [Chloroflexi bacterium]|nr:PEP/pyruvate-binding domain-containing protein [Chloroflexota bacterium]